MNDPSQSAEAVRIAEAGRTSKQRLADLAGQARAIGVGFQELRGEFGPRMVGEKKARLQQIEEGRAAAAAQVRQQAGQQALQNKAALHASVENLAPGPASADWGSRVMSTPQSADAVPGAVRFGSLPGIAAPALLPLVGVPGWVVTGESAHSVIADTILRLSLAAPPDSLRLSVFDPKLRGTLGYTSLFRESDPVGFPAALQNQATLLELVEEMVARIATTAEAMSAAGVDDYRALQPDAIGRFEVLVILDAPSGITDAVAHDLNRIIESAAGRGVFLIVAAEANRGGGLRVSENVELRLGDGMVVVDTAAPTLAASGITVQLDRSPLAAERNNLIQARIEAVEAQQRGSMRLDALLPSTGAGWTDRGQDGLLAVFARFPEGPGGLQLRSSNPPAPNALVGGAVGSGKSNLLLGLIFSLAVRYSPRDLRFHLLDFKEGVEFSRLAPSGGGSWLPHVDSIGLESDREYGLAVLEHLIAEFERRSEEFKAAGVASLAEYRARTRADMPRLVLIADEFQILFEPDDGTAQRAVQLIEHLARKGRAYGVHLVFASQTLSGIQALALKRDAIFGQFHHRISLRNTAHESESILGSGNMAAAELHGNGRAVFNDELGHPSHNRVGTVVWSDPAYLGRLQGELFARASAEGVDLRRPRTFVSSAFAPWPSDLGEDLAIVGQPVSVDGKPEGVSLNRGELGPVAVIGSKPVETRAVLASMYTSIRASSLATVPWTFVVTSPEPRFARGPWSEVSDVSIIPSAEAGDYLRTLATDSIPTGGGILWVVVLDDPNLVASLTDPNDYDRPMEAVERLIAHGLSYGVLFIVCWRSVASYESRLMGELRSAFAALVLTEPGVQTALIAPGSDRLDAAGPRVVLVHNGSGKHRVLVPFEVKAT